MTRADLNCRFKPGIATEITEYEVLRHRSGPVTNDRRNHPNLSTKEFIEDGRYMTRQARQGIFRASDDNEDGIVSQQEYVTNRIITDEAKAIMAEMDEDGDGQISQQEFVGRCGLPEVLSLTVFNEFDTDSNGELVVPEYLRVWGRWARGLAVLRQPAEASE